MDGLIIRPFVLGQLATNSYLIYSSDDKKGFIIDIPDDTDEIKNFIAKNNIQIEFVLLTHGHYDHIGGVDDLNYSCYIHREDSSFLRDPIFNGSGLFGEPFSISKKPMILEDGNVLDFNSKKLEIIHTPGHTPGSISIKMDNHLFTGDALFADGVGRTDFPYGSHETLVKAIKSRILTLSPDIVVYPGHGPTTTVGQELNNPFLV